MSVFREYVPWPTGTAPPYVIAHRGVSAKAPENTLAAFQKAAQTEGVDMIELDVRLSKDEKVIVLHDRTLQRTTTGNGVARNYTLAEIKQYDAGSWFHPAFANERVPTLQEVFELIAPHVWINVEVKSDLFHREPEGLVEDRLLDVIYKCDVLHRVLISSFDHALVARIKRKEPRCRTAVLYNLYRDFLFFPSTLARRTGADVFVCAKHELRNWMVSDAHRNGIAVYVYTLDSIRAAERLRRKGVDGIMSNRPDDIVAAVKGIHPQKKA